MRLSRLFRPRPARDVYYVKGKSSYQHFEAGPFDSKQKADEYATRNYPFSMYGWYVAAGKVRA